MRRPRVVSKINDQLVSNGLAGIYCSGSIIEWIVEGEFIDCLSTRLILLEHHLVEHEGLAGCRNEFEDLTFTTGCNDGMRETGLDPGTEFLISRHTLLFYESLIVGCCV